MFEAIHARLRQSLFFQRFTAFTRVLLAIGFIPPGMKKVLGQPFTSLPTTNSVGYFFDAFFQAHEYYLFVGLAQVLAGLLLLFPMTATLGAVLYLPIIINIAVITISIGFKGTWLITLLMSLACMYLLVWDFDKIKAVFPNMRVKISTLGSREYITQASFWATAGMLVYSVFAFANVANVWDQLGIKGLVVVAAAGACFGLVLGWHVNRMPRKVEGAR